MKFFTRKALVATATAAAVSFAGVSAASAQETSTSASATATTTPAASPSVVTVTAKPSEGSSIKNMKPSELRDWIAVFTAVIGALGTLLAFLSKYFKMPF